MGAPDPAYPRHYCTVDHCRIAYLDEGQGEPILFIHGIPTSSHLWRDVITPLRPRYRCLAPDLLGLGHTDGPLDADYAMPAQAARLVGLLDALGLDRVTVVAHDQGGAAGQILAARHAHRVWRLVLVNCVCYDNWPVPVIRALMFIARLDPWLRPLEWLPLYPFLARTRFGYRQGLHDPANLDDQTIDAYVRPLMKDAQSRQRFKRFALAGDARHTLDAVPGLRAYAGPALVVWGEEDRLLPLHWAERLVADIPRACLVRVPGAGHFLQEERPAELAAAIHRFIRDH